MARKPPSVDFGRKPRRAVVDLSGDTPSVQHQSDVERRVARAFSKARVHKEGIRKLLAQAKPNLIDLRHHMFQLKETMSELQGYCDIGWCTDGDAQEVRGLMDEFSPLLRDYAVVVRHAFGKIEMGYRPSVRCGHRIVASHEPLFRITPVIMGGEWFYNLKLNCE